VTAIAGYAMAGLAGMMLTQAPVLLAGQAARWVRALGVGWPDLSPTAVPA
jgi:hypothetical protein